MWLNISVVSRVARDPVFESRSGHDFSSPMTFGGAVWSMARAASVHMFRCLRRGSEQILGRI